MKSHLQGITMKFISQLPWDVTVIQPTFTKSEMSSVSSPHPTTGGKTRETSRDGIITLGNQTSLSH